MKAGKAEGTGGDARGPRAENKILDEDGDKVVEAGREVSYPNEANPDKPFDSEIDNETDTHVNQVKAGKKMPNPNQTQPRACGHRRWARSRRCSTIQT
jgi:hypothetical protein